MRRRPIHPLAPFFLLALLLAPAAAQAQEESALAGPLRSRNHNPLFTHLLNPPPESPSAASFIAWEFGVNHSSVFAMRSNDSWNIHMDKELTEFNLSVRSPFWEGKCEVGAEAALFISSAGFLDPLVRSYHSAIGVEGYAWQDHFPDGFYSDKLYYKYNIFHLGRRDRPALGDASFWIKGIAAEREALSLAWQAFLQAPTGDWKAGLGSGYWEYGARALARADFSVWGIYSSLGLYNPGRLKGQGASVDLTPIYSGFLGLEWIPKDKWSVLAQFTYTSSPFGGRGYDYFSEPWMDATFGFKRTLGLGKAIGAAISENLNQTGPDFTIHISKTM